MESILLFAVFIACLFLNIPIAFSLGIACLSIGMFTNIMPVSMVIQSYIAGVDSMPLLAVPFFVLAGEIMIAGGIARRLIRLCNALLKNVPGSLAMVTIVASGIFAAISGSGPATVACIGGITIPAMQKAKYDKAFSASVAATAGTLGPIIPPSVVFIMYGITANVSITKLFTGGIVPGLLMVAALLIWALFTTKKYDFGQIPQEDDVGIWTAFREAIWSLLVPVIILGGIYGGLTTPTEAAIIAVDYALIVGLFIHREIHVRDLFKVFSRATLTCGTTLILVATATGFGKVLTLEGIPTMLAEGILSFTTNKYVVLLLINLLLFFVGMFMETLAAVIILGPLMLDMVVPLGVDPVHFGIIMTLNLVIGMCTPPVGVNLFVASRTAGISIDKMVKYLVPSIGVLILVLMLVTYIPGISMFLINLMN